MSNFNSSLEKSFFSLVNKNNGLFVSEKQAKFLSSVSSNNTFTTSVKTHNLGSDYNFKPCGSSQHVFLLDEYGVYQVNKINSKNVTTTYWTRKDQQTFLNNKAKQAALKEEYTQLLALESRLTRMIGTAKMLHVINYYRNISASEETLQLFKSMKKTFVEGAHHDKSSLMKESNRLNKLFTLLDQTVERRVNFW